MRMRKRHNLDARMAKCSALLEDEPTALYGRWHGAFPGREQLYLELGCGKGRFTAGLAEQEKDAAVIAVEKVPDAMIIAMERAKEKGLSNIRFISADAAKLEELFAPGELARIFINFCDPWPKSRDAKFRLTSPGFLRKYCALLPLGGEIHFKTDNTPLFDWSIEQFTAEGWALSEISRDLHAKGITGILTDYEKKFIESGLKINRLVAARTADTKGPEAGAAPRLRNAALLDAVGYEESAAAGGKKI